MSSRRGRAGASPPARDGAVVVTGANLSRMTDTPPATPDPAAGRPGDGDARSLPDWRAAARGTLIERMGITIETLSAEHVVGTMPVAGNTQPAGLLHGGASAALAETLGSFAAQAHAGPGRTAVGIELNATHHRGVREGVVRGEARAVHLGRSTASYEIVVTDEAGRRVCTSRLTCMVIG